MKYTYNILTNEKKKNIIYILCMIEMISILHFIIAYESFVTYLC